MTDMDLEQGFDGLCMYDQLGKILDSQDNPFPRDDVTTDDGVKFTGITAADADNVRNAVLALKQDVRLKALKMMQNSEGFERILNHVRKSIT